MLTMNKEYTCGKPESIIIQEMSKSELKNWSSFSLWIYIRILQPERMEGRIDFIFTYENGSCYARRKYRLVEIYRNLKRGCLESVETAS